MMSFDFPGTPSNPAASKDFAAGCNPKRSASSAEVLGLLRLCDPHFHPPLSQSIDLCSYAEKIVRRAVLFEKREGGCLAGLVAAYFNDPEQTRGFITMVCTHPQFTGRGVARELLEECLQKARELGLRELHLETGRENVLAIRLYKKMGFEGEPDERARVHMSLRLS